MCTGRIGTCLSTSGCSAIYVSTFPVILLTFIVPLYHLLNMLTLWTSDYPLVNARVPKPIATIVVFLFSALLHEVVISVPFRCITGQPFVGMVGNCDYLYAPTALNSMSACNLILVFVWLFVCIDASSPSCLRHPLAGHPLRQRLPGQRDLLDDVLCHRTAHG